MSSTGTLVDTDSPESKKRKMSVATKVEKEWLYAIPSGYDCQWSSGLHECSKNPKIECYLSVNCQLKTFMRENPIRSSRPITISQKIKFRLMFVNKMCESFFKAYYTMSVTDLDNKVLKQFFDQNISERNSNGNEHFIELSSFEPIKHKTLKITVYIQFDFSEQNTEILFKQISTDLGTLLNNKKYSDVVLKTSDNKKIPAHKCLLAARSPVFAAMFTHDMKENQEKCIKIDDADFNTLIAVLQFMYTGKFEPSIHGKFEVLEIADKYDIKSLRDLCETKMSCNINIENATTALVTADKHNLKMLKEKTCKFLAAFMRNNLSSEILKKFRTEHPSLFEEILDLVMSGDTLE